MTPDHRTLRRRLWTLIAMAFLIGIAVGLVVATIVDSAVTEGKVRDAERAERVQGITFYDSASTHYPAVLDMLCPQPAAMTRARCAQWVAVGQCETGGQQTSLTARSVAQIRWRYSGPGYYDGGLQFSPTTWTSNVARIPSRKLTRYQRLQRRAGRYHHAWSAPAAVQILAAEVLRIRIGGNPAQTAGWPNCGRWF